MTYQEFIRQSVAESSRVQEEFFQTHAAQIERVALEMAVRFQRGKKLLVIGNGGSAADAQHMAALPPSPTTRSFFPR